MSPGTTSRAGIRISCAVAKHRRRGRGHLLQRFERPLGAILLIKTEQRGEQNDHADAPMPRSHVRGKPKRTAA